MSLSPNRLRMELGNPETSTISDTQLEIIIAESNNDLQLSVAKASEILYKYFSQKADLTVGDYSEKFSQKAAAFKSIYEEAKGIVRHKGIKIYAGGISKADKLRKELDPDGTKSDIHRGLLEFEID